MVLVVAILIFGPKRIPEISGSMGKGIREFKRHISDVSRSDSPSDSSAVPNSGINDAVPGTSYEVSRPTLPESNERGEPKRLLE
jgi:sec-independent protein translocase protein TatA